MLSVGGDRGESLSLGDTVADSSDGPVAAYEIEEMRQILAEAINRMPEREKIVLTLYYYEGLTLAEIGQVLGVTESRVCQIHTKQCCNFGPASRRPNANPRKRFPEFPCQTHTETCAPDRENRCASPT